MNRTMKIFSWMLLFPVLLMAGALPAAAEEELPTLEQILERYVEVMGGREAISKLETRTIIGKQIDVQPHMGPPEESKLEAWADTSGEWTMILSDPQRVFRLKPQGNTKLAFLLNPQGPLMIAKYFPNLRLTGTWDYDGVWYYKVENDLKFEYYTLYFEVETGMLTRIGYHWYLDEFRPIDGVMVPGIIYQGRKGGSTNLYFDNVIHGEYVAEHLLPEEKLVDE
jgi:hypothetical protein